jgi:hypothetical protein
MSDKIFAFLKPSNIYLSIVHVLLIITGSIIFFDSQSIFTEQLIYTSAQNTESELNKFFNPISNSLQKIRQDGFDGKYNLNGEISLNNYFIPLLQSSKTISSVKYFDSSGLQYLLYQENNTFVSTFRIEKLFNNEVVWKRWSDVDKQMSEWKQNIEKDPTRQNWVNYFHSQTEKDSIYWLRLKGFGDVTIGEITSVSFGNIGQSDTIFGCGIGINIDNLVSSLSEVKLYSDPKIFLINSRDHIIPILMDYKKTDRDIERAYTLNNLTDSLVISFLNNWKDLGRDSTSTFTLDYKDDIWWGQVNTLGLSKSNMKLGVAVSENELIFAYLLDTYVIIAVLLILLIVVTVIYFTRRTKRIQLTDKLSDAELRQMLNEGESKFFELKSSLRWDYREGKVNKKLEEVIVKSISAFNNSEGGYLVIGIDDDNNILGLNNDYASLKKNDSDYFELHLRNLISSTYTVRYTARKINIGFIDMEDKEVCVIKIAKGEYPLFLKTTDKNGNQLEKFYVRSGNSSQEINSLTEINNYINVRFNRESNK